MVTGLNLIGSNQALQEHYIKRVVAIIIDLVILWIVSAVIVALLLPFWWTSGGIGGFIYGTSALIVAVLSVLYFLFMEGFMGGTIGKKVMGLRVVGTTGPMDVVKALIRNVTKIHWILLLIDWLVGMGTEGDPRQKFSDRFGGTTVVRTDAQAYVEEQFRQMATPPPHPVAPAYPPGYTYGQPGAPPPAGAPPGYAQAPPPGYAPQPVQPATPPPAQQPPPQPVPPSAWPTQESTGGGWPQHRWDEQGNLIQAPRFCSACGTTLIPRGDGKMTCPRDGTVY